LNIVETTHSQILVELLGSVVDQNNRLVFETRVQVAPEFRVVQKVGNTLLDVAACDSFWLDHSYECSCLLRHDGYFGG